MKIYFSVILLVLFLKESKADTADFWCVYYNDTKLKESTSYTNDTLLIKSSEIKSGDSIKVFFFREMPCNDCETNLIIDDNKSNRVCIVKGKGMGEALNFSLLDVLIYSKRTGMNTFEVCYFDMENMFQAMKPIIFTIKLE